jgi:hypothetical protein
LLIFALRRFFNEPIELLIAVSTSVGQFVSRSVQQRSVNDFVQRILDDALGAQRLELRHDFANHMLINNRLDGDPPRLTEIGDGRTTQSEQALEQEASSSLRCSSSTPPWPRLRGALEQKSQRLDLLPLPTVLQRS